MAKILVNLLSFYLPGLWCLNLTGDISRFMKPGSLDTGEAAAAKAVIFYFLIAQKRCVSDQYSIRLQLAAMDPD
jgi:hypothetical protein